MSLSLVFDTGAVGTFSPHLSCGAQAVPELPAVPMGCPAPLPLQGIPLSPFWRVGWDGTCPHCLSTLPPLPPLPAHSPQAELSMGLNTLFLKFPSTLGWDLGSCSPCCLCIPDCELPATSRGQPHRPPNPNAARMAQKVGGADGCPRCGQAVYAAEKVIGAGKVRGDGGDGAQLLHGKDTFGEVPELPLSQGWAWVQQPRSPASMAPKGDLGLTGSQVVQAAVLSQTCRWGRNTFYIKYSQPCSAEVTMDILLWMCWEGEQ